MKMVKSLVLGSAAALVAVGGAQAADLPVKAKAVEYVRVCSLYGAGFWYIPGTDTCIKIGGYLRVDTTFNGGTYGQPFWSGDGGQHNRYVDDFASRSRLALQVDTRTATEYGVVRTFGQMDIQFNNYGTANPSASTFSIAATPAGLSGSTLDGVGAGYVAVEYLFLQFAGFTFGKSSSAYSTPWNGFPGNTSSYLIGGNDTVTGVNNIQYTAQFGNGVSASIGLDDPTVYNRTSVLNLSVAGSATGAGQFAYGGTHAPDVVGNVRVDQAWGLFQISAAAHEVDGSYNDLSAAVNGAAAPNNLSMISGHPETKWGGSVMAALNVKNLPTGAGDDIKIDASWAKGDLKNILGTAAASPSVAMFGGSGAAFASLGIGQVSDAVYLPVGLAAGGSGLAGVGGTGDLKLTEGFGVRGAFNHNWDPYWSSSLFGGLAVVHYNGSATDITTAKGQWCASYIAGAKITAANSPTFSCNPDYAISTLGVITRWTPVKNLTFSGEVGWFHLDQKMGGIATLTPSAPMPTSTYEFKNQDTVYLQARVQRNF
jgi:Porin subfamily